MKRYFCLWSILVLALGAVPRSSAQTPRVLPDHFGTWTCKSADQTNSVPNSATNYADIRKEAAFVATELCEYSSGSKSVEATLEKYRDPSGAYEAYTAYLDPRMLPSILGSGSAIDHDKLLALVGNFVLTVRPTPNISAADLEALAKIVRGRASAAPLPPVRTFLPPEGLVQGTQRYALGPAGLRSAVAEKYLGLVDQVGFGSGAEAMLGKYRNNSGSAMLLLVEYPTPQLAELHLRHLETALPADAKQAGTGIERKGSLLSIVLAASSAVYAESLSKSVSHETQVTWNEPSATATDPPWVIVLERIFIGTGIFMIAAVVLGIAFGGLRVVTKIFLPGKVFDRPERMEILQLGLSGKTIDPRDFY
jgi:hypothetical protein